MEKIFFFFVTSLIAMFFGFLAKHYKIAAGAFMGALFGAAAFNILFGKAVFPADVRKVVQVLSGALIGSQVLRSNITQLKKIIVPTIMLVVGMMIMNITAGFLLTRFGGLDAATALFASAPGGLSDMAIIAEDMGANTITVALMQLLRVIAVYIIFPQTIGFMLKRSRARIAATQSIQTTVQAPPVGETPVQSAPPMTAKQKAAGFCITITSAAIGSILATLAGVPAGPMVGALFFSAISNVVINKGYFPGLLRPYIQIFAGAYIGAQMNASTLSSLVSLFVPTIILVICLVAFSMALAFLVHRFTKLDFGVSLLGCAPAGVQEMSLLADDLGVDSTKVAIMHTFRLSTVVALFPMLLRWLAHVL